VNNASAKILTEQELVTALAPIAGFLRNHEAYLLYRIARLLPANAVGAEIGSWMGRSSVAIALGLQPGALLHTIDDHRGITGHENEQPAEPILNTFLKNVREAGVSDRIQHHSASSDALADSWNLPLDFLFIDGDHRYASVVRDIRYIKHLKPGAWLAFHDSGGPEVARAIGEWWDQKNFAPARIGRAGTILAVQLPGPGSPSLPPEKNAKARHLFFWASCEIPPASQPLRKLTTKFRQGRARNFFREETAPLLGK
jgi:hypothetical protein